MSDRLSTAEWESLWGSLMASGLRNAPKDEDASAVEYLKRLHGYPKEIVADAIGTAIDCEEFFPPVANLIERCRLLQRAQGPAQEDERTYSCPVCLGTGQVLLMVPRGLALRGYNGKLFLRDAGAVGARWYESSLACPCVAGAKRFGDRVVRYNATAVKALGWYARPGGAYAHINEQAGLLAWDGDVEYAGWVRAQIGRPLPAGFPTEAPREQGRRGNSSKERMRRDHVREVGDDDPDAF